MKARVQTELAGLESERRKMKEASDELCHLKSSLKEKELQLQSERTDLEHQLKQKCQLLAQTQKFLEEANAEILATQLQLQETKKMLGKAEK